MSEKTIVEGKFKKLNIAALVTMIIGLLVMFFAWLKTYIHWADSLKHHFNVLSERGTYFGEKNGKLYEITTWREYVHYRYKGLEILRLYWHDTWYYQRGFIYLFFVGVVVLVFALVLKIMMRKCEIKVTDMRVIGRASFGKRMDLPISQISAISQGMFSSIAVATSSGKMKFWLLDNRDVVYNKLSDMIKKDQNNQNEVSRPVIATTSVSNADEIKKYKELLDQNIISQEEFDAKKKELLGL